MILKKLYDYPQFINSITVNHTIDIAIYSIMAFNVLMETPVMEQMFHNRVVKEAPQNKEEEIMFKQAEEQVIFFPEQVKDCNVLGMHTLDFVLGKYMISFYNDGIINLSIDESQDILIKTLRELAFYTNGELITKNLEV